MGMIKYLSYHDVLEVYREQISKHGGICAIRDNNVLLSLVANPQREFAGRELYPTVSLKAAIFVYSIIKTHPFADGNKRTAFTCGRVFLRLNGYDVESLDDYYELILKIVKNEASQEDAFEWFNLSVDTLTNLSLKIRKDKK